MSTITELSQTLEGWLRWMRFRRALAWFQHGLNLGLTLALVAGSVGLFEARLLRTEFLALVGAFAVITPLLAGMIAYLWPVSTLKAARSFDRVFHLDERVSTALELNQIQGPSNRLARQQLDDTLLAAHKVRPGRDLPMHFSTREGLLTLTLLLLIGGVWIRGNVWFQAAQQSRAVQQTVTEQEQNIEKILTQVNANNNLTEEQKRALTQPLEQALNDLQNNKSLESSVSILTSTGEKLQALSNPQAQQMSQALQEAGQQIAGQEGSPLQSVGQSLSEGDAIKAASQLSQMDLNNLSPAEAEQLASQLNNMSQALASSNPELASQLSQAAQALQAGNTSAAKEALNQAAKSLAQAGQQATFSQTASQAGQQMQQGAGQVLAAGGGQQMAQGQPTTQGQLGNNPDGTAGSGSSKGQTQGSQTGGSGSGKGESQGSQPGGNEAGSSPIQQNNGPGDGGVTSYEQIYAPTLLGGKGGPIVNLPGSAQGGDVVGQGPTTLTDPGQSLVPYDQVLPQYEQANQNAVDNGSIPFQFIQIIHSYFDSLKP